MINENKCHQQNRRNPQAGKRKSKQNNPRNQRTLANIDCVENVLLEQAIRGIGCFEALDSVQGKNHRELAIDYLEALLGRWFRSVEDSRQQKNPAQARSFAYVTAGQPNNSNVWQRPPPSLVKDEAPAPALIPFGSYRLGVHSTASDLDLLALVPSPVHRGDFFTSFVEMLKQDGRCHQVHPIPSAYTPVIKFLYVHEDTALPIDLVFARVANRTKLMEYQRQKRKGIQKVQYILDDSDLHELDEPGIRSLNGVRVTQIILDSVPDVAKFQTVLRAVKHWALVKGIYSNVLGFLGGVNWALLVAHVCRDNPKSSTSYLLRLFFRVFANWDWKKRAVILNGSIADVPPITDVSRQSRAIYMQAWNPQKNPRDGTHVMPIITPAYPSMNSSYNVDIPQLRRIQEEMIGMNTYFQTHKRAGIRNPYNALFRPSDFFFRYRHFLQIKIIAGNEQHFVEWVRWVETKLRLLISSFETEHIRALPFAQYFESDPNNPFERVFFIALQFAPEIEHINMKTLPMEFLHKVNNWDMRTPDMELQVARVLDEDVAAYTHCHHHALVEKDERSVQSDQTAPSTDDEEEILDKQQQQQAF